MSWCGYKDKASLCLVGQLYPDIFQISSFRVIIIGILNFEMKIFRKILAFLMVAYLLVQIGTVTVYAVEVGKTVLPGTEKGVSDCKTVMNYVNTHSGAVKKFFTNADNEDFGFDTGAGGVADENDILGCGIKTGDIKLWMIPYYIRYVLEFIIQISGLVAVGGIMYGGYLYLFAGISEDKDKGKKAILYGVVGMVLTLVAWALVNIVIAVLTG